MPKNVLGTTLSTSYHGSTDYKIFGVTGDCYLRYVHEDVSWSSSGLDVSTAGNHGHTLITMGGTDPSTSPALLTLAAPVIGCAKMITLASTAAYVNSIDVDLGAGVRIQGASDARYIAFSSLASSYQSISLVGASTSKWVVQCVNSTAYFGAATGIRGTTVARTSA
jgi:hypothetical protein